MKNLVGSFLIVLVVILGWRGAFSAEPSILTFSNQQPMLTEMTALIAETELTELLDQHGPFTLIAPSDAAFSAAEARLATLDAMQKRQLVLYHVVHGAVHSANLSNYTLLGTALGQPIQVIDLNGTASFNGKATFVETEQVGANGVLHVVDAVLFPDDVPVVDMPPTAAVPSSPTPTTVATPEPITSSDLFLDYEGPRAEPRVLFELGHVEEPIGIGPAARIWDSAEFAVSVNTIYTAVHATQKLLPKLSGGATGACEAYFNNYLLVALAPKFSNIPNSAWINVAQYESAVTIYLDRNRPLIHYCLNGGTFSQFSYNLAWLGVNDTLPTLNRLQQAVGTVDTQANFALMQKALRPLVNHAHRSFLQMQP